jgi:hypothetical protein
MMDTMQLVFAACVLLREVIYIALVVSVVCRQPAFLFFDVMANIGIGQLGPAATFILSPGNFILGPENLLAGPETYKLYLRPMLLILDTCAILAFSAGVASGTLYLPLAVLYLITGLSALWTSVSMMFGENQAVEGIRRTLQTFANALTGAVISTLITLSVWSSLCGVLLAGATSIGYVCYVLNSVVHGFDVQNGKLLMQDASFLVSLVFWTLWCTLAVFLCALVFACSEMWPQVFGLGEPKLIFVFAVWLLVPVMLVGECFALGSVDAGLCFVCALLPVALFFVFLFVVCLSGDATLKRQDLVAEV